MKGRSLKEREFAFHKAICRLLLILNTAFTAVIVCFIMKSIMAEEASVDNNLVFLSLFGGVVFIIYFITNAVSYYYSNKINQEKEMLILNKFLERQNEFYLHQEESMKKVKRMHHDIKEHVNSIERLYQIGSNETSQYIEAIHKEIDEIANVYHTGNPIVDMLLYEKKREAEENGIVMDVFYQDSVCKGLQTMHLCTIFSNALNNSIEACKRMGDKQKRIKVSIVEQNRGVVIQFKNTYDGQLYWKKSRLATRKKDESLHGMGLKNIEDVVLKSGGDMTLNTEGGVFTLTALLTKESAC